MAREKKSRLATEAAPVATFQPFAGLEIAGAPAGPRDAGEEAASGAAFARTRVVVRRSTAHRAGKVVTVIEHWANEISEAQIEEMSQKLRKHCHAGGAVRDRVIELQGDKVREVRALLESEGCRVAGEK